LGFWREALVVGVEAWELAMPELAGVETVSVLGLLGLLGVLGVPGVPGVLGKGVCRAEELPKVIVLEPTLAVRAHLKY
jgi:hypothetical protein